MTAILQGLNSRAAFCNDDVLDIAEFRKEIQHISSVLVLVCNCLLDLSHFKLHDCMNALCVFSFSKFLFLFRK